MENGFKKLYQLAFNLAMRIFETSKSFLKEETYSLKGQIRRSYRAICANLAEGYRKRNNPKHFTNKITDADGEASETIVWLDFTLACNYIDQDFHNQLYTDYIEVRKMLGIMATNPEKFLPR